VADLLFAEQKSQKAVIETIAGLLHTWQAEPGRISVDFGEPKLGWDEIPLAKSIDTLNVPISAGALYSPCCVNMGNPHAVFFVPDVKAIDLPVVGPKLETDPMFPKHCNIEIAQILSPDRILMRVWERGAGITEACGSGACAVLVAAIRRGLSERRASVVLDGGELVIEWRADNHVIMTGSASFSYSGELSIDFGDEALTA
jgi:diaminopimelate epimerase